MLDSALRDFAVAFLTDGHGLIGGSQVPTIADFAIALCLHLIRVTDVTFPQAVTEYTLRFMAACPDAMVVADGVVRLPVDLCVDVFVQNPDGSLPLAA